MPQRASNLLVPQLPLAGAGPRRGAYGAVPQFMQPMLVYPQGPYGRGGGQRFAPYSSTDGPPQAQSHPPAHFFFRVDGLLAMLRQENIGSMFCCSCKPARAHPHSSDPLEAIPESESQQTLQKCSHFQLSCARFFRSLHRQKHTSLQCRSICPPPWKWIFQCLCSPA